MTYFPKPKEIRRKPAPILRLSDGRECCNLLTVDGREEYQRRKHMMWERQGRKCCLYGHIKSCPGDLKWAESTFDHEIPRGMASGSRDDRIELEVRLADGSVRTIWQNGAAHAQCNSLKGSRRIKFNAPHNGDADRFTLK